MQGAVAPLQVYCQRRHLHLVVISGLISQTYLHFSIYRFFRRWQPAKPRTGVTTVLFDFESDVWTWFYSNRNHRSTVLTGTIARQYSQAPSLDFPCLQTAAWVRASAATIHSCYHFFQVILIVWCLLHARYTPHQNSVSCFDSSVLLMSRRQDGMSPSREPYGKEPILQSDSEFTLL